MDQGRTYLHLETNDSIQARRETEELLTKLIIAQRQEELKRLSNEINLKTKDIEALNIRLVTADNPRKRHRLDDNQDPNSFESVQEMIDHTLRTKLLDLEKRIAASISAAIRNVPHASPAKDQKFQL